MKKTIPISMMLLTAALITTVVLAQSFRFETGDAAQSVQQAPASVTSGVPPLPALPASVDALVYAQSFVLQSGYSSYWSKERPIIQAGHLIVLKVDPALVFPHEAATPVIYVGNETAERINVGYRDGHVIAIVSDMVDLTTDRIWFGMPALPERVDADRIAAERQRADTANLRRITAAERNDAIYQGGATLYVYDKVELLQEAATLIEEYAPSEQDLADMFRGDTR